MNPDALRLTFATAVLAAVDLLGTQTMDGGGFAPRFVESVRSLALTLRATDALGTATGAVRLIGTGTVV